GVGPRGGEGGGGGGSAVRGNAHRLQVDRPGRGRRARRAVRVRVRGGARLRRHPRGAGQGRDQRRPGPALPGGHGPRRRAVAAGPVGSAGAGPWGPPDRAGQPADPGPGAGHGGGAGGGGRRVPAVTALAGGVSGLPPSDVLTYHLAGARVVIRPSGTEPKVKAYLEVVEPVAGGSPTAARAAADGSLAAARAVANE